MTRDIIDFFLAATIGWGIGWFVIGPIVVHLRKKRSE